MSAAQKRMTSVTSRMEGRGGKMYSFCAWYSFRMSFWSVPPSARLGTPGLGGGGDVHGEEDGGRRIDRHRRGDRPQVDAGEEVLGVGQGVDGHAAAADLSLAVGVVGVAAHEGGQVEGHRQAPAARPQQLSEAHVGVLGGAEAGEEAHGPQLRAVHGRIRSARVRRHAGPAHVVGGPVLRPVARARTPVAARCPTSSRNPRHGAPTRRRPRPSARDRRPPRCGSRRALTPWLQPNGRVAPTSDDAGATPRQPMVVYPGRTSGNAPEIAAPRPVPDARVALWSRRGSQPPRTRPQPGHGARTCHRGGRHGRRPVDGPGRQGRRRRRRRAGHARRAPHRGHGRRRRHRRGREGQRAHALQR